jgi:hypothetical protein
MIHSRRTRLLSYVAAALLSACNAVVPAPSTPSAGLPHAPANAAAARSGSWMAPDAKKLDLLYVSDYQTNDVYAFSYPQGKLYGKLAGILKNFVLPTGLCSDNAGNVFIPDSANSTVLEYAHGSTKPSKTLLDVNELPYSCTVDGTTGDLAVVNLESASGAGGVSIYKHARGFPKNYQYGFIYKWYFGVYDPDGDLFVDADYDIPSEPLALIELRKGGKSFETITLDQTFGAPGGIAWDGADLALGDAKSSIIYRFAISGRSGTKAGSTQLQHARALAQFFIWKGSVVAANFYRRRVAFWKFPAGGAPAKTIRGFGEPFGVTLSRAPADR